MSQKKLVTDGFVRDENGKWHIVPMKLPDNASAKKSSEKKKLTRKYIPIERLTPAISPIIEPKRRKIEKPVRKELFKVPQRKSKVDSRLSYSTRQSKNFGSHRNSRNSFGGKTKTSKKVCQALDDDGAPLLDIDEAEELLINQKLSLNPVIGPAVKLNEDVNPITALTPKKKNVILEPTMTPCTSEFVQLEKTLATVTEISKETESPMSSVCTLLENAKINNAESSCCVEHKSRILTEVESIIKRDKNEFDMLKQQFVTYSNHHQEHFDKITSLLTQLQQDCDENKENSVKKPNGIATQVTITKEKTKFVISPAISKKQDLRKSTLNKNLTKILQTDAQSPRMKKAVDLYNNFRTDCSVLCTPRLDRTTIETRQSSITRSLSRRIQKQCLLLQDTPRQTEY